MVVKMGRSRENCVIVSLRSEDPCPTPAETLMIGACNNVIDASETLCW